MPYSYTDYMCSRKEIYCIVMHNLIEMLLLPACNCSGQADTCHRETGTCYCRTKGTIGELCDSCDESKKYYGDPKAGGTCFCK